MGAAGARGKEQHVSESPGEEILAAGPIHRIVVEFDANRFRGEILPELERLKEREIIRILDLILVRKDRLGAVTVLSHSDLAPDEAESFGAAVGSLIGLGMGGREGAALGAEVGARELADGHLFDADDAPRIAALLRNDSTYVVALLEHTWAIPLREMIQRAGGGAVSDDWIGIESLIGLGLNAP